MPIFYEITALNGRKSHLFGTMHGEDSELIFLPPEVESAFMNAERCIFEIDLLSQTNVSMMFTKLKCKESWLEQQSESIKEHLPRALEITKKLFPLESNEIITQIACTYTPIELAEGYLAGLGQSTENSSSKASIFDSLPNALDIILHKRTDMHAKEIDFLESLELQEIRLKGYQFSYEEHLSYLEFVVEKMLSEEPLKPMTRSELKEAYLAEDADALEYSRTYLFREDTPLIVKQYDYDLINARDKIMVKNAKKYLEEGSVFMAVGALHLKGIAECLVKKGYTVTPVNCSPRPTYQECFRNGKILDYFANGWSWSSRSVQNQKAVPKLDNNDSDTSKNLNYSLSMTESNSIEDDGIDLELERFKKFYAARYRSEFFKNPWSYMKRKMDTFNSMQEVIDYGIENPGSRTEEVLKVLRYL